MIATPENRGYAGIVNSNEMSWFCKSVRQISSGSVTLKAEMFLIITLTMFMMTSGECLVPLPAVCGVDEVTAVSKYHSFLRIIS